MWMVCSFSFEQTLLTTDHETTSAGVKICRTVCIHMKHNWTQFPEKPITELFSNFWLLSRHQLDLSSAVQLHKQINVDSNPLMRGTSVFSVLSGFGQKKKICYPPQITERSRWDDEFVFVVIQSEKNVMFYFHVHTMLLCFPCSKELLLFEWWGALRHLVVKHENFWKHLMRGNRYSALCCTLLVIQRIQKLYMCRLELVLGHKPNEKKL